MPGPTPPPRGDYRGWIAGAVIVLIVVAVAAGFWFRYHA